MKQDFCSSFWRALIFLGLAKILIYWEKKVFLGCWRQSGQNVTHPAIVLVLVVVKDGPPTPIWKKEGCAALMLMNAGFLSCWDGKLLQKKHPREFVVCELFQSADEFYACGSFCDVVFRGCTFTITSPSLTSFFRVLDCMTVPRCVHVSENVPGWTLLRFWQSCPICGVLSRMEWTNCNAF